MTAPKHLSREMKRFWKSVSDEFTIDRHDALKLQVACEAWDRMVQAREAIREHGTTYTDGNGCPKSRPEIKIEVDSRIAFLRALRELAIDNPIITEANSPRPPALQRNASRKYRLKHA